MALVVDQPANHLRELEIGAQIGPVVSPGLRNLGILFIPTLGKSVQSIQGGSFVNSSINFFQISHKGLQVFIADIFAGIAELMDDAVLDLRTGKHRLDCCGKASQVVRTGDENVLNSTVFQTVEDGGPEFGALVFANSHAKNIFFSIQIDTDIEVAIQTMMEEIHSPVTTIPGIGVRMGAMILAEIGDFSRFDSPDKILAYAGLSPSTYQSGQLSLSGAYSHMEKRGSRYLRYALYNATKYVCLWDPTFAAYLAKKRAEGKHYNVALSHAAKKLVRLIYAMEKSQHPYNAAV